MKYLTIILLLSGCCPHTSDIPGNCFETKDGSMIAKATSIKEDKDRKSAVYTSVTSERGESAEEENSVDLFRETFPMAVDCGVYDSIKDEYNRFDRLEKLMDKLKERVRKLDPHHPTEQEKRACADKCFENLKKYMDNRLKSFDPDECIDDCRW